MTTTKEYVESELKDFQEVNVVKVNDVVYLTFVDVDEDVSEVRCENSEQLTDIIEDIKARINIVRSINHFKQVSKTIKHIRVVTEY